MQLWSMLPPESKWKLLDAYGGVIIPTDVGKGEMRIRKTRRSTIFQLPKHRNFFNQLFEDRLGGNPYQPHEMQQRPSGRGAVLGGGR